MPNKLIEQRLAGVQQALNGIHQSGKGMSASSKGMERQAFINDFLTNAMPPVYRFGTGDATDKDGNLSGQLDVVVEYPVAPTLPSVGGASHATRLYLAESVAAVIEVKSNVASQWSEAIGTANKLSSVKRHYANTVTMGAAPSPNIPLIVVGYTGWTDPSTLQAKLLQHPEVAGILVIDSGLFAWRDLSTSQHLSAKGPLSLWCLVSVLNLCTSTLMAAQVDLISYVK